jgi:DNA mismatch repair protein MutS
VREVDGRVVFLRKLQRGGSEHSFGIHVARLAGMPQTMSAGATGAGASAVTSSGTIP